MPLSRFTDAWLALGALALVGLLDYHTGTELRIYPVYFLPISWVAWRTGVRIAAAASVIASGIWLTSNQLAGLEFSSTAIWAFNVAMHAGSFSFIAILLAMLRRSLRREKALARRDSLTGLLNSRAFDERARALVAQSRRYRRALTLAYLDLDDFKAVNDQRGHAAGDDVLQLVGSTLSTSVREVDIVARLGGDEFVLMLPETPHGRARVVLDRVHAKLRASLEQVSPRVGVSIGAVSFEEGPPDLDALIAAADAAMYAGKSSGKDRITLERGAAPTDRGHVDAS